MFTLQTVSTISSKMVLETILRTALGCVHTGIEIVQLREVCCTFGHMLRLSKEGILESGSIACVCNTETSCSG